jgi:hypothetical protein
MQLRKRRTNSVKFRNINHFIYLYTNFYKYSNKNNFFKLFNEIYDYNIVMKISIENAITVWLSNTRLVSNFRHYSGKLFTLLNEYSDKEKYVIEVD